MPCCGGRRHIESLLKGQVVGLEAQMALKGKEAELRKELLDSSMALAAAEKANQDVSRQGAAGQGEGRGGQGREGQVGTHWAIKIIVL